MERTRFHLDRIYRFNVKKGKTGQEVGTVPAVFSLFLPRNDYYFP